MSELDLLIDLAVTRAVAEAGVSPKNPPWSQEEIDYVKKNLQSMSLEEIGAVLGRSANAIKIKKVRLQMEPMSKKTGYLTGHGVAKALGVDIHSVMALKERGLMPLNVLPGQKGILQMKKIRLYMWAVNPEHWPYFKVNRMQDRHLARLVILAKSRWGDEWLRIGQAAKLLGTDHQTINSRINRGKLSALDWGNWWIKRSTIDSVRIPHGKGGKGFSRVFTPAADQFLIKAISNGLTYASASRMMRISVECVRLRYMYLAKLMKLSQAVSERAKNRKRKK